MTPGLHTIDVEYYNGGGGAAMDAQWDPTGGTNFVDIPNSAFPSRVNGVVKTGSGTLTLSNTNTYVGPTRSSGARSTRRRRAWDRPPPRASSSKARAELAFTGGIVDTSADHITISGSGPTGAGGD